MSLNLSLSFALPNEPVKTVALGGQRALIGTLLSNEVVIRAPGVEPIHAMLELTDSGRRVIVDLASASGVMVNGQKVTVERAIQAGDVIEIAGIRIEVKDQGSTNAVAYAPAAADMEIQALEDADVNPKSAAEDMALAERVVRETSMAREISHHSGAHPISNGPKEMLFSPKKAKPSGDVLEVVAYWGDTILEVELFHSSYRGYENATIGDPTKAHMLAGGTKNISRHEFARIAGDGFQIRTLDDMKTRVRRGGEVVSYEGATKISLGRRDIAQVSHGAVRYFLMFVTPPPLALPHSRSRDPIFAMLMTLGMLIYLVAVPLIISTKPTPKESLEDDAWMMVNLPEKKPEPEKPKPEPKKPEPPKPEQKVAEKKTPPPQPKPPKPVPPPVKPATPVEAEKPKQTKPVEKPVETPKAAEQLANKQPEQPKQPEKPSLTKLSDSAKEKEGMASTDSKKPDFKLAGAPNPNKSLLTGGAKGSGMGQQGGARKGNQANSVMGVEGVNNNKASGVNLSKLGLGAGKILDKTGPGAIQTNFRNSAGGAGGGSGSASKTYGLGGLGTGSSLGIAGTGSAVNNFGSGAGGDGGGQGGTGGLGGVGLGSGFGTRGDGSGGKGRANVSVPPGDPVVEGGLTAQEVQAVIRANLNQIRHCYEQLLQRSPSSGGKIKVTFTVAPNGRVSAASISESSIDDSVMKGCVSGKVVRWQFPQPRGGQPVSVTYPFVFNPI